MNQGVGNVNWFIRILKERSNDNSYRTGTQN